MRAENKWTIPTGLKLNTVIRLPDGREGTICWNHLDGCGGVWGREHFYMPDGDFGDLPKPEFMLRAPCVQPLLAQRHGAGVECVGHEYEVVEIEP